jgi:hypothetical protein
VAHGWLPATLDAYVRLSWPAADAASCKLTRGKPASPAEGRSGYGHGGRGRGDCPGRAEEFYPAPLCGPCSIGCSPPAAALTAGFAGRKSAASWAAVMSDDRPAALRATTEATRSGQVACIGRVERVEVPGRPTRMGHVLAEPVADHLLFIPEMDDPRIGYAITIPAVAAIAIEHVEPDRIHARVGVGGVAQNVVLDPTGPLPALGSSR